MSLCGGGDRLLGVGRIGDVAGDANAFEARGRRDGLLPSWSSSATRAPAAASISAVASPRPEAPPVTSAA